MLRKNSTMIITAGVLALMANVAYDKISWYYKEQDPPSKWFVVRNLNVADGRAFDHKLPVIYDRVIYQPFFGEWRAEVKQAGTLFTVCFGSGKSFYEPKDVLPPAGVDLSWFMGQNCDLTPGQYYLEVYFEINPPNYPQKVYRATSNLFTLK